MMMMMMMIRVEKKERVEDGRATFKLAPTQPLGCVWPSLGGLHPLELDSR
jgi:hypothetical protein